MTPSWRSPRGVSIFPLKESELAKNLGKPESLIFFVTDRLGHDRRYAIDASFAQRQLNWKPHKNFGHGLTETIKWYIDHQSWWQPLLERAGRY
jgi:dTDP-glucose 4,6-dehydratase